MDLDTLIQDAAKRAGIDTPAAFHRACVEAGIDVTRSGAFQWWAGMVRPRPEHMSVIARVIGVDLDALCTASVPNRQPRPITPTADAA
jgi:hypothetical protein